MARQITTSQIIKKRALKEQSSRWKKVLKWFFLLTLLFVAAASATAIGGFLYISKDLPQISSLKGYLPPTITTVYSDDNRKVAEFYNERRIVIPLESIPLKLQQAFIATEDSRFFKHRGVDLFGIFRAFLENLKAGAIVQGGSTITQQVTKSFLLSPEKSYKRKIKEAILAYKIDKSFTKNEVLYLYLNQIYLGHGAYGVQAAAENYFGKSTQDLNLAECAMLAGLPQAPSRYSPFHYPERAQKRQFYVLNRMVNEGYITTEEASEAVNTDLDIKPRRNWYLEEVPVYTEDIRRYVERKYGKNALYNEGLKIYAAVNIEMQKAARQEIQKGLKKLDRRQGYRGALETLAKDQIESYALEQQKQMQIKPLIPGMQTKAVVIDVDDKAGKVTLRIGNQRGVILLGDMLWARKPNPKTVSYRKKLKNPSQALSVGDVIEVELKKKDIKNDLWSVLLDQTPDVEAALVCIETGTGLVKVMIGGRDFRKSQFNRASQSRRQPGSAFKPIIYAAALDKGYTPASIIIDSPIILNDIEHDFIWKPKNYGQKFYGPTLLREALAKSRNVVTIKIMQDLGVGAVIDYARKLGIDAQLSRDLSLALGSSGISLLEMVETYSVFANQGYLVQPALITKIEDRHGNILEEMSPSRKKVIEASTSYIMTSLLEGVVKFGTGKRVRALKRPVAGKTGTSNDLFDAWFIGYTPRFITGVWVGFDREKSLGAGENGSRTASPIWLKFMQKILEKEPVRVFQVPEGVVFAKIDSETGLLPIPESKKTAFECFKEGSVPTEYSPKPGTVSDHEQFFKQDM
ncbi:MAG: PBP1A family penicillin-binding protein [Desulfobacteraceae bacterium]|nr:PBP1A family penicillin-binding protein [Desulfobacteraceae bacterium]